MSAALRCVVSSLLLVASLPSSSIWGKEEKLPSIGELFRSQTYPVFEAGGELRGPGFEWLLKRVAQAQFVCLGEQHNSRQIPRVTAALFKNLHDKCGFTHLALEQDPVMCEMVSGSGVAGSRDAVVALANRYPNAFTFTSDQELELLAAAGALAGAKGDAIWGLDQVFGTLHVLDELCPLAPNPKARERLARLIVTVRPYEMTRFRNGRHFIADIAKPDDFRHLADFLRPKPDSRADFLIRQLLLSNEIYADHLGARRGELTGFQSSYKREENMKSLFVRQYRRSQAAGEALPKVLLKFGHAHAIRGAGWSTVLTLGNFVSEFAKSNGMESFHLAIYHNNKQGLYGVLSNSSAYKPLAEAVADEGWAIVDLETLRPRVFAGQVQGVNAQLSKMIFGFDAVLLIGQAQRGTFELTGTKSERR